MNGERARIEFLLARDGLPATLAWVRRTLSMYRRALRDGGYGAAYRRELIESCCDFRRWLRRQTGASDARAWPAGPLAPRQAQDGA